MKSNMLVMAHFVMGYCTICTIDRSKLQIPEQPLDQRCGGGQCQSERSESRTVTIPHCERDLGSASVRPSEHDTGQIETPYRREEGQIRSDLHVTCLRYVTHARYNTYCTVQNV